MTRVQHGVTRGVDLGPNQQVTGYADGVEAGLRPISFVCVSTLLRVCQLLTALLRRTRTALGHGVIASSTAFRKDNAGNVPFLLAPSNVHSLAKLLSAEADFHHGEKHVTKLRSIGRKILLLRLVLVYVCLLLTFLYLSLSSIRSAHLCLRHGNSTRSS